MAGSQGCFQVKSDFDDIIFIGIIVFLIAMMPWISQYMSTWNPHSQIKTESEGAEEEGLEIEIFSDAAGQDPLTEISWGQMQPGSQKSVTAYLQNVGPAIYVTMKITNWQPANLVNFIAVSWDRENSSLARDQMLACSISLEIFQNVTEITAFTFDIVISLHSDKRPL